MWDEKLCFHLPPLPLLLIRSPFAPVSPVLDKALAIATAAHAGQVDKAGVPYIGHVMRVVNGAPEGPAKIVAALHDVIEDCPDWNLQRLAAEGFDAGVLDAVAAITKLPGQNYQNYLELVKANPLARAVKLADLADNMDPNRIPNPGPKDAKRLAKYQGAKLFLGG